MLTKKIREKGALLGKIQQTADVDIPFQNPNLRNLVCFSFVSFLGCTSSTAVAGQPSCLFADTG